jgi:hypothetical protein
MANRIFSEDEVHKLIKRAALLEAERSVAGRSKENGLTTDELNWWENLWGTREGKAKVKRTTNTTEWNYKTEAGIYSTRVLMQQRGERFRIRVSKRQIFGMEWDNAVTHQ